MADTSNLTPFGLWLFRNLIPVSNAIKTFINQDWRQWNFSNNFGFCFHKRLGFYGHVIFGMHVFTWYYNDGWKFSHSVTFSTLTHKQEE